MKVTEMFFLRGVGMGFAGGWAFFVYLCSLTLTPHFEPLLWDKSFVNHMKTGGSESMDRLESGVLASPPPPQKTHMSKGMEMQYKFIAQFFKANSLKKVQRPRIKQI